MIVTKTYVYCDGPNCPRGGRPLNCTGADADYGKPARVQLKGSGWLSANGRHFCGHCRPDSTKGSRRQADD